MKLHPIQDSFAGGEITPKLNARSDTEINKQGLETLTNMLALRHGPAARRGGMKFNVSFPGDTTGKCLTFEISPSQSFAVSVSDDGNLRIHDLAGQLLVANLVSNPYFDSGLVGWTDASDSQAGVIWANGVAGLGSSAVGNDAVLAQAIDTSGAPNDTHEIRIVSQPGGDDAQLTVKVGTSVNANDIAETTLVEGVNSFQFNPGGNASVTLSFVFEGVDPLDTNWSLDSVTCAEAAGGGVTFAHPWDASDISELQGEMPPGELVLFMTAPRKAQQELIYTAATDTFTFGAITFVAPPANWTGSNFPAVVTFFQGRSWWGASPDSPATFWASKSGVVRDMTQGQVADDGMEFTLSRRGRIEWMEGVKNLLIGTDNSEYIVISEAGIIEPGDIFVEQQSAYGSENAQARPIGNQVLYLSSDGTKVREIDYSYTEDGWLSRDLSFAGEHLPLESPMREVHYVKDPESVIACTTAAGEIDTCTYDPNSRFVGWARLNTNGRVISATVTRARGTSVLWVMVNRNLDDPVQFFMERFEVTAAQRDFLDSFAVQVNDPPSTAITGVVHLADQLVQVTVDNATHPDVQLDSNGDGTLDFAGTRIVIGQKYLSRLKTLPEDPGAQSGSAMGMKKRYNRIFTRLLDSALPIINGERQPDRTPSTPMDETEPDRSQDVETRQLGWDQFAQITVEQDLPRDLIVVGIFGELNEETL